MRFSNVPCECRQASGGPFVGEVTLCSRKTINDRYAVEVKQPDIVVGHLTKILTTALRCIKGKHECTGRPWLLYGRFYFPTIICALYIHDHEKLNDKGICSFMVVDLSFI